jgi:serine/threonine protein kinase
MSFSNFIGATLDDKYEIESELGRGGMGTVYLATHLGTERPVAVKIIAPQFMERTEFVERFRREARAAGRLRHPNVVDVTDFGFADTKDGKVAYLVMEYLDGCTLGEVLEEEKNLPVSWTLDILEQVCSAVHEAHNQGIIHRDLKPDNIWLEPNPSGGYTVKVLDFGIAKLEEHRHKSNDGISEDYPQISAQIPSSRATVADFTNNETLIDGRASTAVSESVTIAQIAESKTILAEAGTMIQPIIESVSEDKTAIFAADKTVADAQENVGTQLIGEKLPTGKSSENKITDDLIRQPKNTNELTRVGAVLGTPLFMSPEQVRGEKLSPRSDIYSLGVIAYRMLGGKTPFDGDFQSVMDAHKDTEPPPLVAKKVPKRLKKVIHCALSKNVDERPQTAEAFASQLRSQSEGFGILLQKALVIYTEHLPQFLLLSLIISIPLAVSGVFRFTVGMLASLEIISLDNANLSFGVVGLISFFLQIFAAAFLVGTVTWIVAQILAVPLRPVSVRSALNVAWSKRKSLLTAVTFQSLLSIFGVGLCIIPGVYWSTVYMLIAPTIMMEGLKGRKAFRRSKELVKRSALTALTLAILMYIVPFSVAGVVGGVIALATKSANEQTVGKSATTKTEETKLNFNVSSDGVDVDNDEIISSDLTEDEKNKKRLARFQKNTLTQALMDLVLSPIMLLLTSLSSVITALMYFKTRQAGGESMQELLEQFEENEQPRKKWQERVRNRLIQSGRITSGTSKP